MTKQRRRWYWIVTAVLVFIAVVQSVEFVAERGGWWSTFMWFVAWAAVGLFLGNWALERQKGRTDGTR